MERSEESRIARVLRSKSEARAKYNAIARWYDLLEGLWEGRLRTDGLRRLAPRPGERILEIGSGNGRSMAILAREVGPEGSVWGLDIATRMLLASCRRLRRAGLLDNTRLCCGDGEQLPFASGAFDAIFMSFTLELFDTPEIPRVLAECHRVLRQGGRIGIVALSKGGGRSLMRRGYEWGHRTLPRLLDCRPIFPPASLSQAGFTPRCSDRRSLFGIPVEIVVAIRPRR